MELAKVDYGFLADLCAANDWRLGLARIENGARFRLSVRAHDGRHLAGVKFRPQGSLDYAADVLFDVLRRSGEV